MKELKEYKNLTPSELECADHAAEIGDTAALRRFQQVSSSRVGQSAQNSNPSAYAMPMQPRLIRKFK